MFGKLIIVILCVSMIGTSCSKNKDTDRDTTAETGIKMQENEINKNDDKEIVDISSGKDDIGAVTNLVLNKEWSSITTKGKKKPDFILPEINAKVKPYKIASDLSNIENIDQFSGFSKEQITMLVENGFVVLPGRSTRIYNIYGRNEYEGIPNFITTDSVLHIYHQLYDKSLVSVESNFLYEDLERMTDQILDKSILLYGQLKEEELKKLQEKNIVYFLVANMLLTNSTEITFDVKEELIETAKQEYELIDKALGYEISPLFGFSFDYSQFKVRGHYTRSEELGRFFKTMMWYGTAPLEMIDQSGVFRYENTLQALLISYTTFLDTNGTCAAEQWSNIYIPTSQYVGLSDDIDVFTMNKLRIDVYGEEGAPDSFNNQEFYDKLLLRVKELPAPKIQAKLVELDTPTGVQFRYMGQRYILDSYILQKLMDSILRPLPSALDVMGVLGSDTAEKLIFNEYKPHEVWPEYEPQYKELKQEIKSYDLEIWGNNLYNGWLWSIKEALKEYESSSGMPFFMTTEAWKYKSLNTALGSYAELKHDTVLYGKQGVAEEGGPLETADWHYVEPNVELYAKLLYLTDYTVSVLSDKGMMNERLADGVERYQELLKFLIQCSIKELNNEVLTEEEYRQLLWYGGTLESIAQSLLDGSSGENYVHADITDMLVSDIATYQSSYLSLGTGYFDNIYVVIPVDGKLYLSRGSVYSSYEFVSGTRFTDEEWWELNGIKIVRDEYGTYPEFTDTSEDLPMQPLWVSNFKTGEDNVKITPLEINWDNLVE